MATKRIYPPQDRDSRPKIDVPMSVRLFDLIKQSAHEHDRGVSNEIRCVLWEHYTGEIVEEIPDFSGSSLPGDPNYSPAAGRARVDVSMTSSLRSTIQDHARQSGRSRSGEIRVILWSHYLGTIPGDDFSGY
jgi:hypothetical protein